jgi:glycosyltransferase involved in cell wall biosynthesis
MKILFLEAVQNLGGARISTIELAERLSETNDVLIVDFYGSCKPFLKEAALRNLSVKIVLRRDQPFIIGSSKNSILNIFNFGLFIPHWFVLRNKIQKIIRTFNPDFVIVNNLKTLSTISFRNKRDFETVYFVRGWFEPFNVSLFQKRFLSSNVNRFACVSEATKHSIYFLGLAPLRNIFVVHNAIEEHLLSKEIFQIKTSARTVTIMHCGGFLKGKGQHISVEIAKLLRDRGIDFKMIFVGLIYKGPESSSYFDEILRKINQYDLRQKIVIIENETDIVQYFRASQILIHPSTTEGLPRVIMEAMCLKIPVIANAVGGVTDYILNGFTGFLPRHNSPHEYVEYIELLINDKLQYQFIASNAYTLIKKTFSKAQQMDQVKRLFQ